MRSIDDVRHAIFIINFILKASLIGGWFAISPKVDFD